MPDSAFLFETARLRVRPAAPDDFDFYYRLQSDPVVMHYIRPAEPDPQAVRDRMTTIEKYSQENPGLGAFLALLKDGNLPVGNSVVRHQDYIPGNDLEIGYAFVPEYWGRGYATELAAGLTTYAFRRFDVEKVTAVVSPENLPSQNVLVKCGFRLVGRRVIYDSENFEFILERKDWEARTDGTLS